MMYLIGYVLESRVPGKDMPIWKNQSKAFFPGDAGLALLVATGACFIPQGFTQTNIAKLLLIIALTSGVLVFILARKFLYTPKDYSVQAWNSPTKLWHDYVMFFGFTVVAFQVCVPGYLLTPWNDNKLIGIAGLMVWIFGNIWDFTHDEIPNKFQHPTIYQPIWKKRITA